MERLTDELERAATALLERVDELGGAARAIEARFFQEEIARSAYEYQLSVERGDTVIVGVNKFADGEAPPVIPTPDYTRARARAGGAPDGLQGQPGRSGAWPRALDALGAAAAGYADGVTVAERAPLMPPIIDAVRVRASVGEISDALRGRWGEYRPA